MDRTLAELIKISNASGRGLAFTQSSGGNTSVKTDDGKFMFIKAGGTALKDMNSKHGWRRLRTDKVLRVIRDKKLAKLPAGKREPEVAKKLLAACEDDVKSLAQPSVESHLHALLDKCVIHLHPVVVGAYVNAKNGRAEIEKLFKNTKYPPLWIPYAPPGFMLARKVARFISGYQRRYGRKPEVMMLAKHGLFVTAARADDAMRLVHKVINRCKSKLPKPKALCTNPPARQKVRVAKLAIGKAVLDATGKHLSVSFVFNKAIAAFIKRPDAAKLLAAGALGAAELVYANGAPVWIENPSAEIIAAQLKKIMAKRQKPPTAYVVKEIGLFVSADKKTVPVIRDVAIGSLIVRNWASRFGGVRALTPAEQNFIIKLDLESTSRSTK